MNSPSLHLYSSSSGDVLLDVLLTLFSFSVCVGVVQQHSIQNSIISQRSDMFSFFLACSLFLAKIEKKNIGQTSQQVEQKVKTLFLSFEGSKDSTLLGVFFSRFDIIQKVLRN